MASELKEKEANIEGENSDKREESIVIYIILVAKSSEWNTDQLDRVSSGATDGTLCIGHGPGCELEYLISQH